MDVFYFVEIAVTIIVLFLQLKFFFKTNKKISHLNSIFPLKSLGSDFIIKQPHNGEDIELIKTDSTLFGETFKSLVSAINRYLLKNRGAVDFSIIRSIVERTIHSRENEISSVISLPLYIGLMGTFIGVILGLLKIAFFGGVSDANISSFIGGIFIAMVASFCGLLLTVISNSGKFKAAKTNCDERKNEFYNFLQVELLPHLSNSLYDALDRLKANINDFNEKFGNNVRMFDTNFSSNIWHLKDSVESLAGNIDPIVENTNTQRQFLQELRTIGYSRMAEANIKVFTLMKQAGPNFVEFIDKQKELNASIERTASFVNTIESIMDRVKTFEDSINRLGERIDNADYMGSDLLKKVERKMNELDSQYEVLKQHSQHSLSDINEFFEKEYGKVKELVGHIRNEVERALDFNIDNNPLQKLLLLEKLNELNKLQDIANLNQQTVSGIEAISNEIAGTKESRNKLEQHMDSLDKTLIEINEDRIESQVVPEEEVVEEVEEHKPSLLDKILGRNGRH